jgi:hypothetical protein
MRFRSSFGMGCLTLLLWLSAAVVRADVCEAEASWVPTQARHFVVLAGRSDVFYDRSGPAFVMLIKRGAGELDIGAMGVFPDADGHASFGAVPASHYETFLRERQGVDEAMLRLQVSAPIYERVLGVLRTWERRVREGALLYPDIALSNILLVKQATEELNRCAKTITPYALDWGLDDTISENNLARRVPFEYFKVLRVLNQDKHVDDAGMPAGLLLEAAASVNPTDKTIQE